MKRSFAIIFILCLSSIVRSQNTHLVKFQTPEVSFFNKTIETPVSLSTGIPNISIPLYTVSIRGVDIPITLNYGGGGIKVEEEATWVGLGWSLQYGGQISRKQRGAKDETYFMRTKSDLPNYNGITYFKSLPTYLQDNFMTQRYAKMSDAKLGKGDYMPDEFYFNVLGSSGKMMFNQAQDKFILFPKQDVKVAYTLSPLSEGPDGHRVDFWDLNLADGTKVTLGTNEANTSSTTNTTTDPTTVNSWGIKSIRNLQGDQIDYTYVPYSYSSTNLVSETYSARRTFEYSPTRSTTFFKSSNLSTISFPGGKVQFTTINRLDMPTKALGVISVFDIDNVLVRKIEFFYSYFSGNYNTDPFIPDPQGNYATKRLKLDRIKISGNNVQPIEYRFDYYDGIQYIPSKHSFAQDFWGYFNGSSSSTLIPKTIDKFGGNRLPNPYVNQIFSLKTIFRPEGGRTVFEYECNTAHSNLVPKYFLTADGTDNSFYVGGIRIKSIKNYNYDGVLATHKNYNYINPKTGYTSGWLLSFPAYFENTKVNISDPNPIWSPKYDLRLYSTSRIPLQTTGGAYLGYETVEEELMDQTNPANNLKTQSYFSFYDPYFNMNTVRSERTIVDPNEWLRGNLDSVVYIKNNAPIKKELFSYYHFSPHLNSANDEDYIDELNSDFISFQALEDRFTVVEDFYDELTNDGKDNRVFFNYTVSDVSPIGAHPASLPYFKRYTGFRNLSSKKTITYANGGKTEELENYIYGSTPTHYQLTSTQTTTSSGQLLKTNIKYPADFPGIEPYSTMVQNNIMNVPVEQTEYNAENLIRKRKTNYISWLYPDNEQEQLGKGPLETKVSYKYDTRYYNLQEIQKSIGIKESYLWDGISHKYATAKSINAAITDIAYTSFEMGPYIISAGDGGWTYVGYADTLQLNIPVGKRCFPTSLTTTISKNGLNTAKTYEISYWSTNGAYTVTGSQPAIQGKTVSGWTFFKHLVTGVNAVTISGKAGYIDELKLNPIEAFMTTFNYTPLGLMLYKRDANENATYYDFDGMERLKNIRNQNREIVKNVSMNYKGIGPVIYKNVQITKNFIKNNCATGTMSDSIPFTVYANTYTSTISQADADLKARSDLYDNGQIHANTIGICKYYNVEKSGAFARNDCGTGLSGSSKLYVVPAKSYGSTISQADADALAQNDVNLTGQTYANTNGQCATYSSTVNLKYNNLGNSYWKLTALNISSGILYSTTMGSSYNGSAFASLPSGIYTIKISSFGPAPVATLFKIGVLDYVMPVTFTGEMTFDNVSINSTLSDPFITVQAAPVYAPCDFTGAPGWQIQTYNIGSSSTSTRFISIIANVPMTNLNWNSEITLGNIMGPCSPSGQRSFDISESGRTWEMIIYILGKITIRLKSGAFPAPGNQITFNGTYPL